MKNMTKKKYGTFQLDVDLKERALETLVFQRLTDEYQQMADTHRKRYEELRVRLLRDVAGAHGLPPLPSFITVNPIRGTYEITNIPKGMKPPVIEGATKNVQEVHDG